MKTHPLSRRAFLHGTGALALSACSRHHQSDQKRVDYSQIAPVPGPVTVDHSPHFSVERRDRLTLVRVRADQYTDSKTDGDRSSATLALVPHDAPLPELTGEFSSAIVVRTPVERIAVASGADEAYLRELGAQDRLVAVGGAQSFDDEIRARVRSGEIKQIGYSWHSSPALDVALAANPDVLVINLYNLEHAPALARANDLGLPTIPHFFNAEGTYLGRAEWIKLFGLLLGKAEEAQRRFAAIESRVDELRSLVAGRRQPHVLWAYYLGGDQWSATVRNASGQLLEHAGAVNVLADAHDPLQNFSRQVSTEELLSRGLDAEIWLAGDAFSAPMPSAAYLEEIAAWRDERLWSNDVRYKPEVNSTDWYETAWVRPDIVLADLVAMVHPGLIDHEPFFLRPVTQMDLR